MPRSSRLVRGLVGVVALFMVISAGRAEEGNAKAMKYHSVLAKRPTPGYLYDRFFNTWLDTGTLEDLQQFLEEQVDANDTTSDRLLLAFFHAKQGDDVQALQQFRTALAKDSRNAQAWYEKAVIEARTLDFDTAIADLEKAGQANTDEKLAADIAKLLGKLYVRNHQTDKAVETWQALLKVNPNDEYLYEDIIELQIGEGLYEQAAALSEELISRTKDKYKQVLRRVRTGDIHQRAGKSSKALEVYAATLEQVGHGTWIEREILAQIEQMFRREDDLVGLKAEYDKLLGSYSKRVQIRKNYAKLLSDLGETEAAKEQFQEILRLTPGDRKNSEDYVTLLADSGSISDALTVVQTLIDQYPKDSELRLRQATLHHRAGDKEAASESISKYLEVSDKSEYAYLRAARMLQQFELPDDAAKTYQRLTTTYPESVAAKEAQAAFLYQRDKKPEALAIWKELAVGQDRSQVVRVARILSSRNEHQAAFDLLLSRYEDLRNDPIFLGQIVTEAIAVERYGDALPWARRRVQLAKTSSDLDTALSQAVLVAKKAGSTDQLIATLGGATRSINDSCLLAELYERRGDSQTAEQTLQQIEDQQDPLVANQQIRLYTQRRDWSKATDALERLVQLPEGRKSIYVQRLVELYQREFKHDKALAWVNEWKKLSPGSTLPWLTQSKILVQQDKLEDAIGVLRSAVRQFEGDQDVQARLAVLYSESGKLADAERIFWRLYDDGKDLTSKLRWVQSLAETAELLGKTKQLIEKFEERRRTNRQSIEPLLALAEIHRVSSDYEERRRVLLEAARIKGDDLQLLQQIARIEESEGDWERALATLQRAAALDATTRTKEQIARLHLNYGDLDKGYAILLELVGNSNSDPRSIESIAQAMMSAKDWERAVEFLTPLVRQHPDDYRIRYLLGIACEESGQFAQAIETFAALLADQKEIPGHVNAKPPALPWAGFLAPLESLMPSESLLYLELAWLKEVVYSHREERGRYGSFGSVYGLSQGQTTVQLPHDVDSARKYSLAHLLEIANDVGDSLAEDVKRAIRDKGVVSADVLMEIVRNVDDEDLVAELAARHPTDEGVMALFIAMNMEQHRAGDVELMVKAYDMFKDRRPQLALMVATQLAAVDAKETKLLDEAMKSLNEIKKPNLFLVMSLATALGSGWDGERETELPQRYKEPLTKTLVDWYPKLTSTGSQLGGQGDMVFHFVAGAVSRADDPTRYFEFLDGEVARWRASGQRANPSMGLYGMYADEESFLRPLEFPPDTLSNFPPHVGELVLARGESRTPLDPFGGGESVAPKITPEQLGKIEDPTLRILLATGHDHEQVIEQALKSMLDVEQPELDALLLAASKASSDGNHLLAMQRLDKARFLPMSQGIRKRVDAALVATAIESGAASLAPAKDAATALEPIALLLDLGQKAALRLRRVNLDFEERQVLVGALEELGLESEAEKLENTIASTATPGPSLHYSPTVQPDRITKLLNDGKQEQAMRMIVNDLRATAREALSSYDVEFDHEARQLGLVVQSHGLTEDVLEQMDPGEANNLLKLSQYAVACDLLDQKDKAKAAYERALTIRPKEDAIRMRLIMLLAQDDIDAALVHFRKCDPSLSYEIGYALPNLLDDNNIEKAVEISNALNKFVASLEDTDKHDLDWFVSLADRLADESWTGNGLYSKTRPDAQDRLTKQVREHNALRQKVHDDLCRTMLTIPQLADDGFSRLLAVAERDGQAGEEFIRLARQVLILGDDQSGQDYYGYGAFGEESPAAFKSAGEFLVRHAWKSNNPQLVSETIVPELEKARKPEVARALLNELSLYTSGKNDFLEAARTYHKEKAKAAYESFDDVALCKIVAIWDERRLTTEIQPLVDEVVAKTAGSDDYYSSPTFLFEYASALKSRSDKVRLDRFFNNLTQAYLGPKEGREALVEEYFENERRSFRKERQRILQFVELIQGLATQPAFLFTALDIMEENGLLGAFDSFEYRVGELLGIDSGFVDPFSLYPSLEDDSESNVNVDSIVKVLKSSPFLSELNELRVYEFPGENSSVMGAMILRLRQLDEKPRATICDKLGTVDEKGFGQRLIVAYLRGDVLKGSEAVFELLAEYEEQLLAQPESKQREVAKMVNELLADLSPRDDELSEGAGRARTWLKKLCSGDREELIQRILDAESWRDLGADAQAMAYGGSSLMEGVVDWLATESLLQSNRAKAKAIVLKFVSLAESARDRRFSGGDVADAFLDQVVERTLENSEGLAGCAFVLDLLFDEQVSGLTAASRWPYTMGTAVQSAFSEAGDSVAPDEKNPQLSAFKALHVTLGENFKSHPTTILASTYRELVGQLFEEDRDQFIAWADAEAKSGKYPSIARELAAAARSLGDENERAIAREYYLAVLRNNELPISWRYTIAEAFLDRDDPFQEFANSRPMVLEYAGLLKQMLNDKRTDEVATGEILQAFLSLEQDDQWQTEAVALTEAWNDRHLKRSNRGGSSQYYNVYGYRDWDEDPELAIMLKLNLMFDNEAEVAKLLREFKDQLGMSQQTFGLLVRYDRHSLAARLLRNDWEGLSISSDSSVGSDDPFGPGPASSYSICRYDRQLHVAIPEFLETISQEDLHYLAQIVLSTLPDVSDESQQAPQLLDARVKALAVGFAKVSFGSPARKEKALELLATNKKSAALVQEPLAELAKNINLGAVLGLENEYVRQRKLALVTSYLRASMANGNFRPVAATLEQHSEVSSLLTDYSYGYYGQSIGEIVTAGVRERLPNATQDELATMLPITRQLASMQSEHNIGRYRQAAVAMVAHALAGQIQQYDEWRNGIGKDERALYGLNLDDAVWELAVEVIGDQDDSNLQRRIDVTAQILNSAASKEALMWTGTDVVNTFFESASLSGSLVDECGLFSNDEFLEHGPKIATAAPASGMTWASLAHRQLSAKQHDAAIDSWSKAIAAVPKDSVFLQTNWRMYQANLLARFGRAEEARKLLEDFDRSLMHAPSQNQFDKMLELLKKSN